MFAALRSLVGRAPPSDAGSASAAPAALDRARSAVLEDAQLLELILSAGRLSAADCASAALVCRLWAQVCSSDAVWRAAWLREACSLRLLEASVARPCGCGFRASLAQLRATALLLKPGTWTMDDFSFALDISWRGQPVFASISQAAKLRYGFVGELSAGMRCATRLSADEDGCVAFDRRLNAAAVAKDCMDTFSEELLCQVRVLRSDGALAPLFIGVGSSGEVEGYDEGEDWFASFDFFTHGDESGPSYIQRGHRGYVRTPLCVGVEAVYERDSHSFVSCNLMFFAYTPRCDRELRIRPGALAHTLSRTLPWVLPASLGVSTSALARRVAALPPQELQSDDDDEEWE